MTLRANHEDAVICLSVIMFPGVCRIRPQQNSETVDSTRHSTRQPAVVSLELNSTAVIRTEVVDVDYSRRRQRKPRNRSFSPLRHDTSAARTDVGSSQSVSSCKSSLTDVTSPVTIVSCDSLARHSSRISPRLQPVTTRAALPATTTSKKTAATHLPPLLNADSECRVGEVTSRRKSEGAARPLEVCALRLNPDTRSKSNKAQFHQQQSTTIDANVNSKTAKSDSATSSPSHTAAIDVPLLLSLPLSDNEDEENNDYDDEEEDEEMTEYRHSGSADKMTDRSVGSGMPGVTEASCPILSVRIEFGKKNNDTEDATPPATMTCDSECSSSGDGGGRRRTAGRTPYKTKNAKTTMKPMSPSKAISVAGRGKVVVIDDGVYDQFARRQPPKYLSNRGLFDAMISKRTFSK